MIEQQRDSAPTVAQDRSDEVRGYSSLFTARRVSGIALTTLVAIAAYVAINLHRRGHTTGDDYALYLRQAQSLFEGNIAQVISDNRLLWQHSVGVTPQMYPWGFAVILSPFVRVFGLDYGRLKLVEVACICAWLVLYHGIVRRRTGRFAALALTAVFATAPVYLVHTDQLLTEFPHMLAVAVVIWWLDRIIARHRLTDAPVSELVVLGLLLVAAYNVRREGIVLLLVVGLAQLVDVFAARSRSIEHGGRARWSSGSNPIGALPWKRLGVPHLSFIAGAIIAQFLLPSTLLPDNGNSRRFIPTRLFNVNDPNNCPNPASRSCANYPWHVLQQLGLTERPVYGLILLCLAVAGVIVACAKAPRLNVPLGGLMISTMLVVGTHFRMVARYYFQVTPLILFFVTVLLLTAFGELGEMARTRRRGIARAAMGVALAPALWLATVHMWSIPSKIDAASRFNDAGSVQSGPTNERAVDAFAIVEEHTRPDDIIVFFRARTLSLYTDRRALQLGTTAIPTMTQMADYYMQNIQSEYSQPVATRAELEALGYVVAFEDANWRLWRIPHPA